MRLTDFDALTFDCYGTLIDWESGIVAALAPLLERAGQVLTSDQILETFARHESPQQQATPAVLYPQILEAVYDRLAQEWQVEPNAAERRSFGASVPDWPAFPDSVEALRYLKQHYKLVILSNIDRASFKASNARLGVAFDHVYTAQDIGAYKPDPRNFTFLIEHLAQAGIAKDKILHTAESLYHDHLPANRAGLASAWIYRRFGKAGLGATHVPEKMPDYQFQFKSMAEMAEAHAAGH